MSRVIENQPDQSGHWEPKHPFDLVIAYEDVATRERALRLHDHLARQLSDDFDVRCAWWKFAHLAEPSLGEQAAEDAAGADMIVLALHPGAELPPAARAWIDSWSHRRDHRKCALVTLFAEADAHEAPSPLMQHLRQAARLARMDFFTNISEAAGAAVGFTVEKISERARAVTPTLEAILNHHGSVPRWNLNQP